MRQFLDKLEQFAVDVILERRYGKRAAVFRFILLLLSLIYKKIIRWRHALYQDRILSSTPVGCLVISIGNLTVGGTGKTPVVEKFARALQAGGRKVAILSRGYKSKSPPFFKKFWVKLCRGEHSDPPRIVSDGQSLLLDSRHAGDEPFMLGTNLRGIPVLVDKDRVKSALYAIRRWGVDTLLLDDGFQYLPLQQRLDVVLVDRQAPFGNNYLLPRGTLREPPDHLKRADIIFITKCEAPGNDDLVQQIRIYNRHAEIIECRHVPLYCQHAFCDERHPLDFLDGKRIVALSGIAAPDSFENFLKTLGGEIVHSRQFADHHRYSRSEIQSLLARAKHLRAKAIITTEKDAVRLPVHRAEEMPVPIFFLRVEIQIISGRESFEECVNRICRTKVRSELGVLMPQPDNPMPFGA